ncbi:hypothetical protein GT37_19055 [Pseudomonas putida]|jgi:hypothetical protein|nr:hypothetical protein GT37_19055 [Pseudomonas putida]
MLNACALRHQGLEGLPQREPMIWVSAPSGFFSGAARLKLNGPIGLYQVTPTPSDTAICARSTLPQANSA